MAYTDWDQIASQGTSSQILNSTLSNPLTVGAEYCRRLVTQSGGAWNAQSGATLKSTYAGGSFFNVPNTRSLRLQAYLRVESHSNNSTNCLAFGGKLPNNIGGGTTASSVTAGYALGIGVTATNTLNISLYTNQVRTALPEGGLGSVALNTWYGLRLEVFSQGAAGDRVLCYRESSPGSGTWVQLYDSPILAASPSYVAWGGNRKTGFSTLTAQYNAITGYIDGVNFAVGTTT